MLNLSQVNIWVKLFQMINNLRFRLQRNFINLLGKKTKRKILVIESDDWGAIRMPNKKVYEKLLNKCIVKADDAFAKYDGLESKQDLDLLYETLGQFKDINNNAAVLTANVIVANPDFKAIKESEFKKYTFEDANVTSSEQRGFILKEKWNEGLKHGVFYPQLHGREHVNVSRWLNKLQKNDSSLKSAFELGTYVGDNNLAAAFNSFSQDDEKNYADVVKDAVELFHKNFGFHSKSFIAPNYTWPKSLEEELKNHNIFYLQGSKWQNIPKFNTDAVKKEFHYFAQKNSKGMIYLVRNCLFEPAISPHVDYVDTCLRHIENAFYWNKPAIIASHRLNFVSVGGEENRNKNLKQLSTLLQTAQKKWPEMEFLSTEQLCIELENKTF
jgi:hypothetical protein